MLAGLGAQKLGMMQAPEEQMTGTLWAELRT